VTRDRLGLVESALGIALGVQGHRQQHGARHRRPLAGGARGEQRPEQPRGTQVTLELERPQPAADRIVVGEGRQHRRLPDAPAAPDHRLEGQRLEAQRAEIDRTEVTLPAAEHAARRQTDETRPHEPRQPDRARP
jgi:hypothetical protein